jgi:ATP-dependent Clp protease protease subunit
MLMELFNLKKVQGNTLYEEMYKNLLKDRIIYINSDIDENTVDMVTMPILYFNEIDKEVPDEELKPITLWINSYGGSADVCVHLIEIIEKSRIPVNCRVLSVAASAGLYITLACKHRVANENSVFLLHKGSISLGNANMGEAEEILDFYKGQVQEKLDNLIINRTKIDKETLKKIRRSETYCMGKEALENYGFIDGLV